MSAVFEDVFMDIQTEMVQIGLDLVEEVKERVDKIYILGVFGDCSRSINSFVKVGNRILANGKVTSKHGQPVVREFLDREMEQMRILEQTCKDYKRPLPQEIRLTYDLKTDEFEAEYGYEEIPYPIGCDDLVTAWMEEEQKKYPLTAKDGKASKKRDFRLPFFWKK